MRPLLLGSFVCSMLVTGVGAQNVTVIYGPTQPVVVQPSPQLVIMRSRPVEEYVPTAQVTCLIALNNSQYLAGSDSPAGHSVSNHPSGRGFDRQ